MNENASLVLFKTLGGYVEKFEKFLDATGWN